ncbi:hypothetical protein PPERSA_08688 [Pseudocohnilembus persalinus]|uniref:Centromere protein J C-terminal domain-containing protein n=1 Tax=Pseudocohnilembus persalinus TaxID=266149 RepID=A0A0V0R8W1_PSEPJ|nr:hypothetical protein PPERSA_08688 [Pseudocohnilembus persalinus]|eukprot:KRX10693.1 hypothetical protein PPERSA_08688 [Pseudocohnilembus persalinus]
MILPDQTIIYHFKEQQTTQITLQSGIEIYRFQNGQIEIHKANQDKEIKFPDGTERYIYSNGEQHSLFPDGVFQIIDQNNTKTLEYPNGYKEIYMPDGTVMKQKPESDTYYLENNNEETY